MPFSSQSFALGLAFHSFPAVIVDPTCKVLHRNGLAISMLEREAAHFQSENNRLIFSDADANVALRSFVTDGASSADVTTIRIPTRDGSPPHWMVLKRVGPERRLVLVSFRLRDDASLIKLERLMASLDLTHAEAEIAASLANGQSIQEIAEKTRRKVPTLRWHISNILRKADCTRQADLTRLVILLSL